MNPTPIFAATNSWESLLIFAALVLISAVSNWLTKKRAGKDSETWPTEQSPLPIPHSRPPAGTPPPATAPPPVQRLDWEEELRRLLGGEEATTPPPLSPPRPPPAPVSQPAPAVAPKPVKAPPTPVVSRTAPRTPFEMPPELQAVSEEDDSPNLELSYREMQLARMDESRQSHQRAARVPGDVAEQMQRADEQVSQHTRAQRRSDSSEAAQIVAMLRQPRTARQAFVASLVFGPPKAFEN